MSSAIGRDEHVVEKKQIYLNSSTAGLPSKTTITAMSEWLLEWQSRGGSLYADWDADAAVARTILAEMVFDCSPKRLSLLNSASAALALTLHSFIKPLIEKEKEKNVFIIGGSDFSSTILPIKSFQQANPSLSIEIVSIPFKNNRLQLDDLIEAIEKNNTALVSVSHIQSSSGYLLDIEELENICKKNNTQLFVDVTQSAGLLKMPELNYTFVGGAGYKWLCGPKGIGFLKIPLQFEIDSIAPVWPNWNACVVPHQSYYGEHSFANDASRFDMSASWILMVGFHAALRSRRALGFNQTLERLCDVGVFMRDEADRLQLQYLFADLQSNTAAAQRRIPIMSLIVHAPNTAADIAKQLATDYRVLVSARDGFVRFSPNFFSTEPEITSALEFFKAIISKSEEIIEN